MTNLQLLLSIGIPTTVLLIAMYQNHKAFAYIDKRFDLVDKRIDGVENGLGNRIDGIDTRLIHIEADLRQFYATLGAHGEAIDILKKRENL